jgi:hypothetical protein
MGTRPLRCRPVYTSSMKTRVAIAVALLFAVMMIGDAFGCPNCKDAVDTSDPDGLNLARGYFYSILLMLAMPFTLVGSFGCYVWREMRRQQREQSGGR